MSRIYDALKQSENSVVRMIEDEQRTQPERAEASEALTAVETLPELPEMQEFPAAEEHQAIIAYPPAEEVQTPPSGYRMVTIRAKATVPILPFDGTDPRTAEAYRILRTNILHHPARPKMIAVSSAGAGDGKTTNAINLAGALALKQGVRVLLIDADLRNGTVAMRLGIDPCPGLAEALAGACPMADAIVQTANLSNLFILPGGQTLSNPAELLDSDSWRQAAGALRQDFDFIVVDTTPIGMVADYDLIQVVCDGTIMIVRPDHTDRNSFEKALLSIPKERQLGVLLNHTAEWLFWRTPQSYGYYGKTKKPLESGAK